MPSMIPAPRLALALLVAAAPLVLADDEAPPLFVEGYTQQLSYLPGDELVLHLSSSAPEFSIEIARAGGPPEPLLRRDQLPATLAPTPEDASSHGCRWPEALRITIPADWRPGLYLATLRVRDHGGRYTQRNLRTAESQLAFVVRSPAPGRDSRILLQLAFNTANAYNNWGGSSLYAYHGRAGLQGHRVSFDRPLDPGFFHNWEIPFLTWAEAQGYRLDYAVNTDLEFVNGLLDPYRLVLSVGHDEYWSAGMRDQLEAFIGGGGNAAFFSGNAVCWQVRSEDGGRALLSWKQAYQRDSVFPTGDHRLLTTLWSHHLVGRPENTLTGVGFLYGGYHRSHGQFMDGSGAFTVHRPDHWIFENTNLQAGDAFGGASSIVGYECDGCEFTIEDGSPVPTHRDGTPESFVILGTAPARWHPDDCEWYERWEKGRTGAAVTGIYTRGGTVFTAGTTDWAHGLRDRDPVVERITRNILDRLGND